MLSYTTYLVEGEHQTARTELIISQMAEEAIKDTKNGSVRDVTTKQAKEMITLILHPQLHTGIGPVEETKDGTMHMFRLHHFIVAILVAKPGKQSRATFFCSPVDGEIPN